MHPNTTILGVLSCAAFLAIGCGSGNGSTDVDDGPGPDAADATIQTDVPGDPGTAEVVDAVDVGDVAFPCRNDGDCAFMQTDECTAARCNPDSSLCELVNIQDDTPCQVGSKCLLDATCQAGRCAGTPVRCDDDNPCTDDDCVAETGCQFLPNQNDCDDDNPCTTGDRCSMGVCTGEVNICECTGDSDCEELDDPDRCRGALVCRDNSCVLDPQSARPCPAPEEAPCVVAVCDRDSGRCAQRNASDGIPCLPDTRCIIGTVCLDGACQGGMSVECDDGNPCTDDMCDPMLGCVFTPNQDDCDDGNGCTVDDKCVDGICMGDLTAACGCFRDLDCAPFQDENRCNGNLVCVAGQCTVDRQTIIHCELPPGSPCMRTECVPATGECLVSNVPDGRPCDDGNACTQVDSCLDGICLGGIPVVCTALDQCHVAGTCDPDTGLCSTPAARDGTVCDDGDPCTQGDACLDGICTMGGPVACQALDQCHVPGTCDPDTGLCSDPTAQDGTGCSDGDPCTLSDSCLEGICNPGPIDPCDDDNIATLDWCEAGYGCRHLRQGDRCEHPFDMVPRPAGDVSRALDPIDDSFSAVTDDWIFGTTDGFLPDYSFDCGPGVVVPDVVYRFTTNNKTGFRADLYSGSSASHLLIALRDDCDSPATLACDFQTPSDPEQWTSIRTVLEPGTYYMQIQSLGTGGGSFGLQASYVSLCDGVECQDRGPCTWGYCDQLTGECVYQEVEDGYFCWLDYCLQDATCLGGECLGTPVDCDDGNPDTVDNCNPDWGCTHQAINDRCAGALKIPAQGTQTIYGNLAYANFDYPVPCALPYTVPDVVYTFTLEDWTRVNATLVFADMPDSYTTLALQYEQCGGQEFLACDVQFNSMDFSDFGLVLGPGTYFLHVGGLGASTLDYRLDVAFAGPCDSQNCDDGNPCTVDECDNSTGECTHDWLEDGNPCPGNHCLVNPSCQGGECVGEPVDCDDGNPATIDFCLPDVGCVNQTTGETCADAILIDNPMSFEIPGSTEGSGLEEPLSDCGAFVLSGDVFYTFKIPQRTGVIITLNPRSSQILGASLELRGSPCGQGATISCSDEVFGNPTPSVMAVLDPGTYYVVVRLAPMTGNSSDFVLTGGFVDPCGVLDCDDGNPCTDDACDPEVGRCVHKILDGEEPCQQDQCMTMQICVQGQCQYGVERDCDDGDPATFDGCDPETGCWNALPGDDCRFPYPIKAESQTFMGSTNGLGNDYPGLGCSTSTFEPEIVYTFELTNRSGFMAWLEPMRIPSYSELIVTSAPCAMGDVFFCASQVPYSPDAEVSGILEPGTYWILVRQEYEGHSDFNLHLKFEHPCAVMNCDDDNPCTEDRCDLETGYCMNEPNFDGASCESGPCVANGKCVDGDCIGEPLDCNDQNPLTTDRCDPQEGCVHGPVNDVCQTAWTIDAAGLQTFRGTTRSAESDYPGLNCGYNPGGGEVVFRFYLDRTSSVGFQLSTPFEPNDATSLVLVSGDCQNGQVIGCIDKQQDQPGFLMQAGVLSGGQEYYLMVRTVDPEGEGWFDLTLSFGPPCRIDGCDDNDPCTQDICDEDVWGCVHEPISGPGC